METIIVICLMIVIVLLLQDKTVIHTNKEEKSKQKKTNPKLPDIMGQPKPLRSLSVPKMDAEGHNKNPEQEINNFDIEIDEDIDIQIPQEQLDDIFRNVPDLEQEEEEWNRYGIHGTDDGFAQGVTFEELSSVGMLLQKNKLQPSEQDTAIALVQKIQGTELFSLLENSIESASRKIAELLDGSLSSDNQAVFSTMRKNDVSEFDIGDFV